MAFNNYLEDEHDKPYFTTNSLAYYYDKMEGFAEKVEGSAKALNLTKEEVEKRLTLYIQQNKNELDQRLAQWDGKLETFDSSVETLLSEWVDDGTLNHVIDSSLIDQKIEPVTAKLVETENQIPSVANVIEPLKILNPYGNYQNIHPKVLYFESAWNGFKYWMGYTPYTKGNVAQENPCLAVSNDGVTWTTPVGVTNPVQPYPGLQSHYNNDTHLVYIPATNTLEIWWRVANSVTKETKLQKRTSTNGSDWTATVDTMISGMDYNDHVSPAIIYENGKYRMWSITRINTYHNVKIVYNESVTGTVGSWSTNVVLDIGDEVLPWHIDVIKTGNEYEFLIQSYSPTLGNNFSSLYHIKTTDFLTFTKPKLVVAPSNSLDTFDNQGIYRSSFIKIKNIYYVYYSGIDRSGNRGMSLAYGERIEALKGYQFMKQQIEENTEITNVLDVKQKTNPNRYGGLKTGTLLFANGATDGVPVSPGNIRYIPASDTHQRYDLEKSAWVELVPISNKMALVGKNVAQPLTSGSFVELAFGNNYYLKEGYANNAFTVPKNAMYRFDLGITISGLSAGDDLEIWLYRNGASSRPMFNQKVTPTTAGLYFLNASTIYNLVKNDVITIMAKYTGGGTPTITQYPYHNTLYVEMV